MLRYHRQSRIADAELRPTILTGNYLGAAPAAVSLVRPSSRHRTRCSALTHHGIPAIRKERVIGDLVPLPAARNVTFCDYCSWLGVPTCPGPRQAPIRTPRRRRIRLSQPVAGSAAKRSASCIGSRSGCRRLAGPTWIRRLRASLNGWRWVCTVPTREQPVSNRRCTAPRNAADASSIFPTSSITTTQPAWGRPAPEAASRPPS